MIDHPSRGIVGAFVVLCLSSELRSQSEPGPVFDLSFGSCPGTLSLPFGTPWEREVGMF